MIQIKLPHTRLTGPLRAPFVVTLLHVQVRPMYAGQRQDRLNLVGSDEYSRSAAAYTA
jgi:hypothetical protein